MKMGHLLAVSTVLIGLIDPRAATFAIDRASDDHGSGTIGRHEVEDTPFSLRVNPFVAFAPATVRATIRVPQRQDNRLLRVAVTSGGFFRRSDIELKGAEAAVSHHVLWENLPAGRYVVTAELYTATRRGAHRVAQQLRIVGF